VAIYGASGTAVDLWTAYVRRYLQARFGDGGPGIVSAAPHNRWYRHHELEVEASKHWTKHNAYTVEEDDPGWFGPMGVALSARSKHAWATIGPSRWWPDGRRVAYYELLYVEHRRGGAFTVRLDGKLAAKVSTRLSKQEAEPRLGIHRLPLELDAQTEAPVLRIDVKGNGEVRMLGVIAETGEPGVVVDTLGVDGARISNQLRWHEQLWAQGLRHRDPALVVLAFGNNASMDEDVPIGVFESGYRRVLQRLRATVPDASCVMLGPGDFPKVGEDKTLAPRPRLGEIREVERRLAAEHGCAFFDTLKLVGGDGAKQAWVDAGLSRDDYLHLTRAGYVRLGLGFGDALMHHYDWTRLHQETSD
jgi:lysophospholipase L1-like esterase